jgi:hypothetical protein
MCRRSRATGVVEPVGAGQRAEKEEENRGGKVVAAFQRDGLEVSVLALKCNLAAKERPPSKVALAPPERRLHQASATSSNAVVLVDAVAAGAEVIVVLLAQRCTRTEGPSHVSARPATPLAGGSKGSYPKLQWSGTSIPSPLAVRSGLDA